MEMRNALKEMLNRIYGKDVMEQLLYTDTDRT